MIFFARERGAVQKRLHRFLAEAPTPLMSALFIILLHPFAKISLQFLNAAVDLPAKGDAVELIQEGFVETLADAIGLRAARFCPRLVEILNGQIELILMSIMGAAEFRATICQNTIDTQAMLVKK